MPLLKPAPLKVDTTKCFLPGDYIQNNEVGASLRTVYRRMKGEATPYLNTIKISGVEFIYLG